MITQDYLDKQVHEYFMIKAVQMKNFRCFSQLDIEFNMNEREVFFDNQPKKVGPLTVIVAKNGMGKSTVLDTVRVAFGTFTTVFGHLYQSIFTEKRL